MNNLEWVRKEAAHWVADGIITPEQQELIERRYPVSREGNPLLLFFAILGSLLIGVGIVLIFATNWWRIPIAFKIVLAFLPLLAAQLLCLYIFLRKYQSIPFREGGAIFLCLAIFAATALIGQVFHTASSLEAYVLTCILFSLPGVYLFHSKAAMAIYAAGAVFAGWSWPVWVPIVLACLALPFFWMELADTSHRGVRNYLLFLLSALVAGAVAQSMRYGVNGVEVAMACGLALLLIDALLRRFGGDYFFSAAKLFAILCITATLLITSIDFSYRDSMSRVGVFVTVGITAVYAAVRYTGKWELFSSDLFAAAALVLVLALPAGGVAANLLVMALGVYYIVQGSRTLALLKLNYGMALIILLIAIRFFDSQLDMLARGIVAILLGGALLGINVHISRKRRGESE